MPAASELPATPPLESLVQVAFTAAAFQSPLGGAWGADQVHDGDTSTVGCNNAEADGWLSLTIDDGADVGFVAVYNTPTVNFQDHLTPFQVGLGLSAGDMGSLIDKAAEHMERAIEAQYALD